MSFILNLNHNDEIKREAVPEPRLPRRPVHTRSTGRRLIDTVLVGQGAPAQPSIKKEDPLYNEQLATQFTAFDAGSRQRDARQARCPSRDANGIRLDEKGRRVSIIFELDQSRTIFLDMFQLDHPDVQGGRHRRADARRWTARCGRRACARAATSTRRPTSSAPMAASRRCWTRATTCRPIRTRCTRPGWQLWYRDRKNPSAIEPPALTQQQFALYDKLKATADAAGQAAIMKQILQARGRRVLCVRRVAAAGQLRRGARTTCSNVTQHDAELVRLADARRRPCPSSISRRDRIPPAW